MNLPVDLKHYRAPRWYDSAGEWIGRNWQWGAVVVYFIVVLSCKSIAN